MKLSSRKLVSSPTFHIILASVWVLLLIPTMLWWSKSVLWVIVISLYANFVGHWSAYQAARAERQARVPTDDEETRSG